MTEIILRAWVCNEDDEVEKYYGDMQYFTLGDCIPPTLKEIMRYTGLKDKNGTKIFEDDIICFYGRGNSFDRELKKCTAQVIMYYARWYAKPIHVPGLRYYEFNGYRNKNEKCEIIGNIYENPELLED